MSARRTAGMWAAFLTCLMSLLMIFNNASLLREQVQSEVSSYNLVGAAADLVEVRRLPHVERRLLEPHPCHAFRVPAPPKDPKRTGPRPCPVCYLDSQLAISQIPPPGTYTSPTLKRLTYVSGERAARKPAADAPGSAFGGYPSLHDRAQSFQVREQMTVHCGFVKGSAPGLNTGFDFDDVDRTAMQACQGVVVASAIFGNYDQMQQPKNISEESKRSVCFFMFIDSITQRALQVPSQVGLWRVVVIRNLPYRDARRTGKIPKLLLHRLFPFARFSIWVDGKLELVQDPYKLLERFLWRTNDTFAISQHYRRFDVFVEAEANKAAGKYSNKSIDAQMEFYKSEGLVPYSSAKLPITSDVPEGCVIIREHTPIANLFSCLWFNEVDRFTSRDQLSFGIVRDKLMASVPSFHLNMFRDCERRDFVVQVYHMELLKSRGILPSNSSSKAPPQAPPAVSKKVNSSGGKSSRRIVPGHRHLM